MSYLVETKDRNGKVVEKQVFESNFEAMCYVEEQVDEDLENGEYEERDYYINGEPA